MGKLKKFSIFISENIASDEEIEKHSRFADGGDEDSYKELQNIANSEPQNMDDVRKINKANQAINNSKVLYEGSVKNLIYDIQDLLKSLMDETVDTYLASENNVKNDISDEEVPVEYNMDEISKKYADQIFELVSGSLKESAEYYENMKNEALDKLYSRIYSILKVELIDLIKKGDIEDIYHAESYLERRVEKIPNMVWDDKEIESIIEETEFGSDSENINESVKFVDGKITFDDDDILFFESRGFDHYGRTSDHPDFLKEEGELILDPNSKMIKQIKESLGEDATVKELKKYMKDNLPYLSKWTNDIIDIWALI